MAVKRHFYEDVLPFTAMVSAEFTNVGLNTLFKAASLKGLSYYVFIVYSYAISTLVLLPALFIYRRITVPPSLRRSLLSKIFLLACIGFLAQIVGTRGIDYSSPTLASAMSNLTPAFTFILAVIFRMERLRMSSSTTQAKIIGTIASIAGALVVVLYKGPSILSNAASPNPTVSLMQNHGSPNSDWLIGGLLLSTQYILYAFWYIIQTQILMICPIEALVTFSYTLCVTIISAPVCFMAEKNLEAWQLRPDITSVAIFYSGILGSCYSTFVHTWGIRMKGPIYVALFKPLSIAIAAFTGVIFLGDAPHLGIIIGAVVISLGFYAVIWGNTNNECSSNENDVPFLQIPTHDM